MNTNTVDIYYRMATYGLNSGGATFARDAYRPAYLPNRYIVAVGAPYADILPATRDSLPAIAQALRALSDDGRAWPNHGIGRALGLWVSAGKMYVDVVDSWQHGGYALHMARERNQLAIFDSREGVDIRVSA